MRTLAVAALVGIWEAAASLGAPFVVTAVLTLAAAALALWALAVLRR